MYRLYEDLREKLGEPQWHDEQGVPRYCDFHPSRCGIYDRYVALLEISCQGCEQAFLVSASWDHSDEMRKQWDAEARHEPPPPRGPELPTAENEGGSFGFGDAPWHGEQQCSGTTMATDTLRVVEFWSRDGGTAKQDWRRRPEYEFQYD